MYRVGFGDFFLVDRANGQGWTGSHRHRLRSLQAQVPARATIGTIEDAVADLFKTTTAASVSPRHRHPPPRRPHVRASAVRTTTTSCKFRRRSTVWMHLPGVRSDDTHGSRPQFAWPRSSSSRWQLAHAVHREAAQRRGRAPMALVHGRERARARISAPPRSAQEAERQCSWRSTCSARAIEARTARMSRYYARRRRARAALRARRRDQRRILLGAAAARGAGLHEARRQLQEECRAVPRLHHGRRRRPVRHPPVPAQQVVCLTQPVSTRAPDREFDPKAPKVKPID